MTKELAIRDTQLAVSVQQQEQDIRTPPSDVICQDVAEMITGSYPNGQPHDRATYLRAFRAKLKSYPASVVARIADPKSGIVTRCRFLPTIAEIDEFAQPFVTSMQAALHRDRETVRMIEARDKPLTQEQRQQNAERLRKLSKELKTGPVPANAGEARKLGWPEWLWDADEQSPEYKRRVEDCRRSQGSGEQLTRARIEAGMIPPEKELVE